MRIKVIGSTFEYINAVMFMLTDRATNKTSAAVSAVNGNTAQSMEKSVVTRRTHVTNDYVSKKSTAATDLESIR